MDCIRSRNLDVLIDLNGYSAMNRLAIYTVRLAAHVIGWFNHYAPASLPGIDSLFGDAHTIREGEGSLYGERLVRLPLSYLAFRISHPAPDIVSPPCRTANHLTFGSLCTQYKITPDVLHGWARLLRDAPRSRLILVNRTLESDDVATYVRRFLEREGISADRISLRGGGTHFDYLKNYNDIDISLDPWPYNGGTTTTESIWQGVPVLSFRGDRWASLTSASLLADGPFSAFVHDSQEAMLQFAISFAASPTALKYLSDLRLTARSELLHSTVCDVTGLARSLN